MKYECTDGYGATITIEAESAQDAAQELIVTKIDPGFTAMSACIDLIDAGTMNEHQLGIVHCAAGKEIERLTGKEPSASALGKKGGSSKSDAKIKASRSNGAKRSTSSETYSVTANKFHGGRQLYHGVSLTQAVKIARKNDCGECKCGGPSIERGSDGAIYLEWQATKPFHAANEPWWEKP